MRSARDVERFLRRVGIALRYGPTPSLPLASLFDATSGGGTGPFVVAAELTNHLLKSGNGVEVSVVANRLTMVDRAIVPAVYRLVRRDRRIDDLDGLSLDARRALALLQTKREVSVGDVRAYLGRKSDARPDPGYEALAELSRLMLIDRGPYAINTKGIHYLSKDGYPHHLFHEAHADLVRDAARLSPEHAADAVLSQYLRGAVFCAVRTLKSMFKALLTAAEVDATLARAVQNGGVVLDLAYGQRIAIATAGRRKNS